MTTVSQTLTRPAWMTLAGVGGFAVALAAASQVAIPIPGTPVPFTLQPLVVLLAGMWLGPVAGAASMIVYLAAGAAGLPVFAPLGPPGLARLLGPTGGFLIAFPAVAFVTGALARRLPGFRGRWMAAMVGLIVLFAAGVAQLAIITGSFAHAVALGVSPFAAFDIVKALIAAALSGPRVARIAR